MTVAKNSGSWLLPKLLPSWLPSWKLPGSSWIAAFLALLFPVVSLGFHGAGFHVFS